MEAFSLIPSISVAVKAPNFSCVKLSARTKRSMVCCQTGSHAIKSTGISSVLTETSSLVSQENGSVVMENGSLVLTPNGKEEGIGIVKFLRGKTFLITGATGFLGKVVIRPSVIESTHKEPFPGWMEGNRMMDPIILQYGKGQLTGFLVDPNGVLDVVPADMVVNATLAAMAKHGAVGKPECSIYQVASSVVNPLVFRDLAILLHEHFTSSPIIDSTGTPVSVPKMKLFSSMEDFSDHLWRDAIHRTGLGALTNLEGKLSQRLEGFCRKSVEQAKYLASIYESYTFYGGRFDNRNTERLMGCMSKEERQQFGFEVEKINWKEYITNVHIPGLRRHVMKGRGNS